MTTPKGDGERCPDVYAEPLREWLPSLETGDPTPPPAGKDTERESLRGILHEFCAILLEQSQAGRSLTSNACEDAIRTLEARMARR